MFTQLFMCERVKFTDNRDLSAPEGVPYLIRKALFAASPRLLIVLHRNGHQETLETALIKKAPVNLHDILSA